MDIELDIVSMDKAEKCDYLSYFRVEDKPIFSNDILDFWSPVGNFPGYKEGYEVGICKIKKPFNYFNRMEKHTSSAEILIPINKDMFVPVAPPGDKPKTENIVLVPVKIGEGILLKEGVWHFAAGPINPEGEALKYYVFLKVDTPKKDLIMEDLNTRVIIKL